MITAELLRESGVQDGCPPGETHENIDADSICGLIVDLVGSWDVVRAALVRADNLALPRNTPGLTADPSSPDPPQLGKNVRPDMKVKIREQDRKIDGIYNILKSLERRFDNFPGGHTEVDVTSSMNNDIGAKSLAVNDKNGRTNNRKNRKNKKGGGPQISTDSANSSPAANNDSRRPPDRYKAIYSTPTTIGSPISQQTIPRSSPQSPSSPPDDFPPLPGSSLMTTSPKPWGGNRGRPRVDIHPPDVDKRAPKPAPKKAKPPALLVKGTKSYPETIKAIKDRMDPRELGNDVHFTKTKKGELLVRFANNDRIEEGLRKVKNKLTAMGPEVVRKVTTLGRLDRLLILDIDPSTGEEDVLDALKAVVPRNLKGMIRLSGLWQTTSGYAKAIALAPRGVFTALKRIKIGFFPLQSAVE